MPEIEAVPLDVIHPPAWRSTYATKAVIKRLADSLVNYGMLAPIVANARDTYIIDGTTRWQAADLANWETVPVTWLDMDQIDARIAHIQLNRHRADVIPPRLSRTIREILASKKYEADELADLLGMSYDEFDLLAEGSLLKLRKVPEHKFSRAWVPVETEGRTTAPAISIERPPNQDR